ncbi:MAG: hypothetical protein KIT09_18655 [Bryobacteraceae bacterium]|nr:hypothetical protein [Bryobacteraceae bacterium]
MAKIKPVKGKKKKESRKSAIPCFVLIISGMALLSLLFYAILRSAAP